MEGLETLQICDLSKISVLLLDICQTKARKELSDMFPALKGFVSPVWIGRETQPPGPILGEWNPGALHEACSTKVSTIGRRIVLRHRTAVQHGSGAAGQSIHPGQDPSGHQGPGLVPIHSERQ